MEDSLNSDVLLQDFQSEVCAKGCKPFIGHWDRWARDNVVVPAVTEIMNKMRAAQYIQLMIDLADDLVRTAKKRYVPILRGKYLCQEDALATFGDCLKLNLMLVVMSNLSQLMPLVAEPTCVKEKAYLDNSEL
jgi:hypothetical protein